MPPIRVNRRRFLGSSVAAGWAISQGREVGAVADRPPVKLGLIGLGNRGTALLRAALELPKVEVVAVADPEPRHRQRALGIAQKASGRRPEGSEHAEGVLGRDEVEAVLVALPCDLHDSTYADALRAGKHLYAEKPLAMNLAGCDALIAEAGRRDDRVVHVGFQRRSNPRFVAGVGLIRDGEIGEPLEARVSWTSSNGPVNGHRGWLARRERSGDWMIEQGVHVWDWLHWVAGAPPVRAFGRGHRDLFADVQPERDVTDHYSVTLEWPDGFAAHFVQSWVDPADDAFTGLDQRVVGTGGGVDFGTGTVTFRDRSRARAALHPGNQPDTRFALAAFLEAIRNGGELPPPVTLAEAREATLTGLMVRAAVDQRRVVTRGEVADIGAGWGRSRRSAGPDEPARDS